MNSGAEAVETALKAVRKWAYKVKGVPENKAEIVVCENNFHGRTIAIISMSTEAQYKDGFGPLTPGFRIIPYGDAAALEQAITPNTAAFIVEPIQGEAGMIAPPAGYLAGVQALCKSAGTLFILDEIQTGLGRTGTLFAAEHDHLKPDVVLLAKALGGGLVSLGACICSERTWVADFGLYHSSTFANNHLSCAVGVAVLEELMRDEGQLVRQVAAHGAYLRHGLQRLVDRYPAAYAAVSGLGLMQGLMIAPWEGSDSYFLSHASSTGTAVPLICGYLMAEHHILTAPTFNHSGVLRIEPSLTITMAEIDRLLLALEDVARLLTDGDFARLFEFITGAAETPASHSFERSSVHG
jgi:acetylornithine/succinyldiaminopimelate/putrescine aminotransferase